LGEETPTAKSRQGGRAAALRGKRSKCWAIVEPA
jgi:hypothetical protein